MTSRTSFIVWRATVRARSVPISTIQCTCFGLARYCSARSRQGCCSRRIASMTGCLQSRQPMPGRGAAGRRPLLRGGVGVDLVELPDRAARGVACVAAAHALRVGGHLADLGLDLCGLLAHLDGIAIALAHLLAVEPRQARDLGVQRLWLVQHGAAGALEVAQQHFGVLVGEAVVAAERRADQRLAVAQRHGVTVLAELSPLALQQIPLRGRQLGQPRGHVGLEARRAAVQVVEAAGDLAGELDVGVLVLADGHEGGLVDQDVGRLEQWVAEESVGGQVALGQLLRSGPCRWARAPASPAACPSPAA